MLPQSNITDDWLTARVRATPDKPFLYIGHHEPVTFGTLNEQVNVACMAWRESGIKQGDTVGLLMYSDLDTIVQTLTAIRIGTILVPLNIRLTVDEIDFQLRQADCSWLLPYGDDTFLQALRARGHKIPTLRTICKHLPPDEKSNKSIARPVDLNAPFAIIHTSGTSGRPKGAVLTYNNIYQSAMASAYQIGVMPDDRWLCVLPLFHVGGLSIILRSLLYGTAVELVSKFNVDNINRLLTEQPITLASLVPTMLYRLLEARTDTWHQRLRLILLGGAAPSPQLVQRCVDAGIPIATTYGLSEASSQVATSTPEIVTQKPASVGKPLMFSQVRIIDENGNDMPTGEIGEVLVKSPTIMQGYYNNPGATAEAIRDGWLYTGDMGYKDADDDLYIVQRRSDLIVTGGENVYPAEVENALRQYPTIKEVVVVGVDDAEWGQRVVAAIQLEDHSETTSEEIMRFAREHLAGYKIPRKIQLVENFPQTASGKIKRNAVRDIFDDDTRDR